MTIAGGRAGLWPMAAVSEPVEIETDAHPFLAAGFIWGLLTVADGGLGYVEFSRTILGFFFACVSVAGIAGAITVSRSIFFVQGLPALLGLGLVIFG